MEHKECETKKLNDLRKGDIIWMRIPFEENTPDYYNGHNPKDIRGELFKDPFGNTSKSRFVIVIGRDQKNIIYLPLTSRHSRCDNLHQYELQDNSMTHKKDPNMKSYVECSSLRAVYANPEWDIQYNGKIAENDMANIMSKVGKQDIDFESKRDQRTYVSRSKEELFEKTVKENGYTITKEEIKGKTYSNKEGKTITKSRWGLVKYHVPLSKEEVTDLIAKREGKPVDEFAKAVADITEKSAKESGEIIQ